MKVIEMAKAAEEDTSVSPSQESPKKKTVREFTRPVEGSLADLSLRVRDAFARGKNDEADRFFERYQQKMEEYNQKVPDSYKERLRKRAVTIDDYFHNLELLRAFAEINVERRREEAKRAADLPYDLSMYQRIISKHEAVIEDLHNLSKRYLELVEEHDRALMEESFSYVLEVSKEMRPLERKMETLRLREENYREALESGREEYLKNKTYVDEQLSGELGVEVPSVSLREYSAPSPVVVAAEKKQKSQRK